jgi:hypothetical protein
MIKTKFIIASLGFKTIETDELITDVTNLKTWNKSYMKFFDGELIESDYFDSKDEAIEEIIKNKLSNVTILTIYTHN